MSAGAALVTLHGYLMCGWKGVFPFHQVTGIGCKRGQTGLRMTAGADPVRMGQTPCLFLQPLPVRKRYPVQLAKNGKWTYHKYVSSSRAIRMAGGKGTRLWKVGFPSFLCALLYTVTDTIILDFLP